MKRDSRPAIRQIASLLNVPVTEDDVKRISDESSFASMKARPLAKYSTSKVANIQPGFEFFRKGEASTGKQQASEEQKGFMEDRIRSECHPVGLKYD